MVCKITFTEKKSCGGVSFIEFVVASGLAVLIVTVVSMFHVFFLQGFAGMENHMSMAEQSRVALDKISKEIRQADSVVSSSSNSITFQLQTNQVTFAYDPTNKIVFRKSGGKTMVLVRNCEAFSYALYQRVPSSLTNAFYPATAANCKVVQIDWACVRTILGKKVNGQHAQSAKIVIRKQKV